MRLQCTAFCLLWLTCLTLGHTNESKIVCYYVQWTTNILGSDGPAAWDIDASTNLCTHLIYGAAGITGDGNVSVLLPRYDLPDNGGKAGFQKFNALRKRNDKLKTLISGGDEDGGYANFLKVVADTSLRSKYVKNVVDFLLRHEFDGFDVLWHFTTISGKDIAKNLVLLVKDLRASFDEHDLILSLTVAGTQFYAQTYYNIPEISKYVDFIVLRIQSHDTADSTTGHSTPLYPASRETTALELTRNIDASVHFWLNEGAPAEKLILGTRLYGIGFQLNNSAKHLPGSPASGPARSNLGQGLISYNEICKLISREGWTIVWDEEQHVPYAYAGKEWISFDNVRSLTEKAEYVRSLGLGGVGALFLDLDDHLGECGGRYPLLKTLNRVLRQSDSSSVSTLAASKAKTFCLYASETDDRDGYPSLEIPDMDPTLCTHMIYGFVGVTQNGDVLVTDPELDLPENGGEAGFQKLNALRERNQKLKTLVSSSGSTKDSTTYSKVVADASLRSKYVKNVVIFLLQHEFDGFDIYWKYPNRDGQNPDDVENFVLLLKELRASFDRHKLILSIQVEGAERFASWYYDIPEISKYVHFILLAIDCHEPTDSVTGHSAPLYHAAREISALELTLNTNASVHYWLDQGAPAEKLILVTRLIGMSYILKNPTQHVPGSPVNVYDGFRSEVGYIAYNEICGLTSQANWTSVWDEEQRVAYSYAGSRWISYDNNRSLTEKAEYVRAMGLGGVMAFTVDEDDHRGKCGERFPLLKALNRGLRGIGFSSVSNPDIGSTFNGISDDPNDAAKRSCAKFHHKYVRHSQNCAKFWICVKIQENDFHAEPFTCGHELYFDTINKICRSKDLVQCG